jgi:hypothetical protein
MWNSSVLKWHFNEQNSIPQYIGGVADDLKADTW